MATPILAAIGALVGHLLTRRSALELGCVSLFVRAARHAVGTSP
ncbi:hypothetical protein [Microlunatus soli]|nr:hypothetical protein [Microlunatus soli]